MATRPISPRIAVSVVYVVAMFMAIMDEKVIQIEGDPDSPVSRGRLIQTDGKGWLFAPAGLVDGPFPAHYLGSAELLPPSDRKIGG